MISSFEKSSVLKYTRLKKGELLLSEVELNLTRCPAGRRHIGVIFVPKQNRLKLAVIIILRILSLSIAVLPQVAMSQAAIQTDLLVVLYDAGETFMLQPVLPLLTENGINYKVLVMATARNLVSTSADFPKAHQIDLEKTCGVTAHVDPTHWERLQSLDEKDLQKVATCVEPKIILTGMASRIQVQIAQVLKRPGVKVSGAYDGFNPILTSSVAYRFLDQVDQVLVPLERIRAGVRTYRPHLPVEVVGQPALEKWVLASRNIDRNQILRQLPYLNPRQKTILYVGGYGDDYAEAFELFVQSARQIPNESFIVSAHPKMDGAFEKDIISQKKATNVHVLPSSVSTLEAAYIADLVVTQRSTVGTQALFLGRPVVYLDVPQTKFSNFSIENGWASQVTEAESFQNKVREVLANNNFQALDYFAKAKIPRNSAKRIADRLVDQLASSRQNRGKNHHR